MPYKDKEKAKQYRKEYYARDKGKWKQYHKEYRRKNKKVLTIKAKERYKKYKNAPGFRERVNSNQRQHYWRNPNKFRKQMRERYYNEPEKSAAKRAVFCAIRAGKLTRPDKCSNCNKLCVPDAHHPNYSEPLNVIWLCHKCHANLHLGETRGVISV